MTDGERMRGSVTDVVRVGTTVRRRTGPWTPSVHAVLRHLERVGFDKAPRVLGFDEEGREILTFISGKTALRPWPRVLRTDDGPGQIGYLVGRMRDALATLVPPPDATWRTPGAPRAGATIRHGDIGPWNTVWRRRTLVGLIDWDFAEPAPLLADIAQAAWYFAPLRPDGHCTQCGFSHPPDRRGRLVQLLDAYGHPCTVADVVDEVLRQMREEQSRTSLLGHAGIEPWATFLARGDLDEFAVEERWLLDRFDSLVT